MSAALQELLQPSGLGNDLLLEWAPWARDDGEGRASWCVKPRVDVGRDGEPPERWYVVNRIVSKLLHREADYRRVVKPYYLGDRPAWEIASSLKARGFGPTTELGVNSIICYVCSLVEREYLDYRAGRR